MKDRSDDPSQHERTFLPRSYISLPQCQSVHMMRSLYEINPRQWSSWAISHSNHSLKTSGVVECFFSHYSACVNGIQTCTGGYKGVRAVRPESVVGGGWFEVLWNLECPVGLSQKRNMCAFQ